MFGWIVLLGTTWLGLATGARSAFGATPSAGGKTAATRRAKARDGETVRADAADAAEIPGRDGTSGKTKKKDDEAHEDGGLLPFLPRWFPLGPPWKPEAARRAPPMPGPETMLEAGAAGSTPKPDLPTALKSEWSLIPVPIVYADPNLGFGIGLMPVVLLHPRKRIEWIIAPSMDYNDLLGVSFTNRIFYYPTLQEELFVFNDFATSGSTEHEARFHGRDRFFLGSDFYLRGYLLSDPTRRFYGLGASTGEGDESDYRQREVAMEADLGYRVTPDLRLAGTLRFRSTRVRRGIVDKRPDTIDAFPSLGGIRNDLTTVLAFGARATLDLRDDPTFPSQGLLVDALGEVSARGAISSTAFVRWTVRATGYLRLGAFGVDDALVSVGHLEYHEVRGDRRLPFWEMPTLGGRSRLRGFGVGRFTDEGYLLGSVEERLRVYETEVRDNRLRVEVAGFLDLGRVFGRGEGLSRHDWQAVPGVGARILIPDSGIVARGDVGLGSEGPAVFLVLGYPF